MKLVRYVEKGREMPGVLDAEGAVRSLAGLIDDISPATLPSLASALGAVSISNLPLCSPGLRLGAPFARPGKIVCIGLNYRAHAREAGMPIPEEPVVFLKAPSALSGPFDPVVLPNGSAKCDWEVELGIVIGRTAKRASVETALDHVFGYCIVNDVSERAFQLERAGQWTKGKSADTFCPVGPYLVTKDEVGDPHSLGLSCAVNDRVVQSSNTADMIFSVPHIISYLSDFMTLEPGDLICTGTPEGVGLGLRPPRFLAAGDVMTLAIDGLGEQRLPVISHED